MGSAEAACEVAVVDKLDCPALLGIDLGREFIVSLLTPFLSQKTPDSVVPVEAESLVSVQASQSKPIRVGLAPDNSSTQLNGIVRLL